MADTVGKDEGIQGVKGRRGVGSISGAERKYIKPTVTKPRRESRRSKSLSADWLEQRAVRAILTGDESILERIVYKRLITLGLRDGTDFIYQYPFGRFNVDFAVLTRPSGKKLAIEPHGAKWHGPSDFYQNTARFLEMTAAGWDYLEIWEYEMYFGDEYLDEKIMEAIGAAVVHGGRVTEIRQFRTRELHAEAR